MGDVDELLSAIKEKEMTEVSQSFVAPPPVGVAKRYMSLRTIASILHVLGWVTAVLGVIVVIAAAASSKAGAGGALLILVGGTLYVGFLSLWLFAGAALIHLMIDMEENTRLTAQLMAGNGSR